MDIQNDTPRSRDCGVSEGYRPAGWGLDGSPQRVEESNPSVIKKGSLEYLCDCEEILINSELGRRYFTSEGSAKKAVLEGLELGNLYITLSNGLCVGFIWYIPKGAFHSFPYLHIIAIKEGYRGKGIGKMLMDFLEELVFADANKLFLVVADFNPGAKRFYEKIGYNQVGEIPNLYRKGVTEYLMMKEKEI